MKSNTMDKTCNVVMLASNQAQKEDENTIYLNHFSKELILGWRNARSTNQTIQHLYITSDEKIKENEYCITEENKIVRFREYKNDESDYKFYVFDSMGFKYYTKLCKKIIATTDTSLMYYSNNGRVGYNLPNIPIQFIKQYIEGYNKGNIITKVEVEYDKATYDKWLENGASPVFDTLKSKS